MAKHRRKRGYSESTRGTPAPVSTGSHATPPSTHASPSHFWIDVISARTIELLVLIAACTAAYFTYGQLKAAREANEQSRVALAQAQEQALSSEAQSRAVADAVIKLAQLSGDELNEARRANEQAKTLITLQVAEARQQSVAALATVNAAVTVEPHEALERLENEKDRDNPCWVMKTNIVLENEGLRPAKRVLLNGLVATAGIIDCTTPNSLTEEGHQLERLVALERQRNFPTCPSTRDAPGIDMCSSDDGYHQVPHLRWGRYTQDLGNLAAGAEITPMWFGYGAFEESYRSPPFFKGQPLLQALVYVALNIKVGDQFGENHVLWENLPLRDDATRFIYRTIMAGQVVYSDPTGPKRTDYCFEAFWVSPPEGHVLPLPRLDQPRFALVRCVDPVLSAASITERSQLCRLATGTSTNPK